MLGHAQGEAGMLAGPVQDEHDLFVRARAYRGGEGGQLCFEPTFRTPIHRFLEMSESATNPGTMRSFSSRSNLFLDCRYLGTLWPTAPILRSSRENGVSM